MDSITIKQAMENDISIIEGILLDKEPLVYMTSSKQLLDDESPPDNKC